MLPVLLFLAYGASLLFWISGVGVLLVRALSPSFQSLTQYGGRSVCSAAAVRLSNVSSSTYYHHQKGEERRNVICGIAAAIFTHRISRKAAFISFYCSGVFTCIMLMVVACSSPLLFESGSSDGIDCSSQFICPMSGALLFLNSHHRVVMPLTLFLLHCSLRLGECLFVHRFRRSGDTVTLFAAASGSVFYVVAATSIFMDTVVAFLQQKQLASWTDLSSSSSSFRLTEAAFVLYVLLRIAQLWVHYVLATLRNEGKQRIQGKSVRIERVKGYTFPVGRGLFKFVLEPHYTLEVAMYAVLTATFFIPQNSSLEFGGGGGVSGCRGIESLSSMPPGLLTSLTAIFSLLNLSLTAAEHRAFWNSKQAMIAPEDLPRWNILPGIV